MMKHVEDIDCYVAYDMKARGIILKFYNKAVNLYTARKLVNSNGLAVYFSSTSNPGIEIAGIEKGYTNMVLENDIVQSTARNANQLMRHLHDN